MTASTRDKIDLSAMPSSSLLHPTYIPSDESVSTTATYQSISQKEEKKEKLRNTKDVQPQYEIEEKALKNAPSIAIDKVIITSMLFDLDSAKQAEKIKNEFNAGRPVNEEGKPLSCFSTSIGGRGEYLNRDEYLLGHRNKVPELASFNKDYNITKAVKMDTTEVEVIAKFKHYDLFFGAHGVYVLNVPQDKYALAMSGNQPRIYGPGPHVIKDALFRIDTKTGLINQNEPVIKHGNLYVIRVPRGSLAKVWIGTEPYILAYRPEPYVFNTPLFRLEQNGNSYFFNINEPLIKHGTIYILRIPAGSFAKAWDGNKPILLPSREKPYFFDSEQFRLEPGGDPFFDASQPVIEHGTIRIIRVPAGYIALVQEGSVPRLLESRDEPYYFDSPAFRLIRNDNQPFFPTTKQLIEYGSIKRILPPINHEAVVSNGGNLTIIKPNKDGSPTLLTSPSEKFIDFINREVQTVTFPSKKTIEQRVRDKNEYPTHEIFRTKDSLEVGVTLLVGFQITDPQKAIETLGMNGIETHIEHLANVDMNKAIQQSSSQEFLTFYQTKPHRDGEESSPGNYGQQTVPPPQHYQDIVKKQLADDLRKIGIEIIRLNIENPKIINKAIAAKMEEQSMLAAEANAKEAVLRQNYNIEIAKADREAAIKKVAQDQVNQALLSNAQAKLDAAKMEAEARLVGARADAEAKIIAAKAAADAEANAKGVAADADAKAKVIATETDSKTKSINTDAEAKAILMKAEAEVKAIVMRAEAEAKASLMKAEAEAKALAEHPELRQMRELKMKMDAVQNMKFFPPTAGTLPPGMAMNPYALFSQYTTDAAAPAVPAAVAKVVEQRTVVAQQ